ncbi:LLM class F420-dependent oxidoreductase [Streptomyces sp. UG1]|uniref:LLM class F420-dependent oxidoreductase n=1 Tax=Streptomyces sp. UG1 TaxID=3417652 RepID=UPI003CF7BE94
MLQPTAFSRLGLTAPLPVLLADHKDLFRELADAGYTDIWTTEAAGTDAFSPLLLAAAWEPRLNLGTGIASVFTRGPALLAQSAAALAEAAPGRAMIGIGASSPIFTTRWNSIPHEAPYQRVVDTLAVLRRALAGERVDHEGKTLSVRGVRLERPPAVAPPVVLAALRQGMIRLAARAADGVMINWLSAQDVRTVAATYAEAGGSGPIVDRIMVCPNPDAELVRAKVKPLIARYLSVPGYAEFQRWLGRGEALTPMWKAWEAGDRTGAAKAVPDEVVDELVVHGTPEECRRGLAEFVASGVTVPVVALLPYGVDPIEGAMAIAKG